MIRVSGGDSHLPAERDGVALQRSIGADRKRTARCTYTQALHGDRFEAKPPTPDTMGTVSTHQSVAVVGPPRDRTPRQW